MRLLILNLSGNPVILLIARLLSVKRDIFQCQCKGISHGLKVEEAFFISLVSECGQKGVFWKDYEGLYQKEGRMVCL